MNMNTFQPDYTNILKVLYNQRPSYLPLYEHHIDAPFIEKYTGTSLSMNDCKTRSDYDEYFRKYIDFWKSNTYDAFDFEAPVCDIFPGHGAIFGGMNGPIQTREDFERYPFDELPDLFREKYTPHFEAIRHVLPEGMKAYGGCGYGIFEAAQDLVGYENLCLMQYLDPDLFTDLFLKIGDLYETLWEDVTRKYSDIFVFFRMGDDLGHSTSTMLEPDTIRTFILPQYKRIIDIVHNSGKKFLLHSCGKIFDVMPDILALGIDAKHSNEDSIAPFDTWIERYSSEIGLFGGFDMNFLILNSYDDIFKKVSEEGAHFRATAKGYGIGSGNSIPDYMPVEGFRAMIDAVNGIRKNEK